jgi:hypothetical protein
LNGFIFWKNILAKRKSEMYNVSMVKFQDIKVQYIKSSSGETVAAIIPIHQWNELESEFKKFTEYFQLKKGIRSSFQELKKIKKGNRKEISLKKFLDEC